jgi:hypothetical protein
MKLLSTVIALVVLSGCGALQVDYFAPQAAAGRITTLPGVVPPSMLNPNDPNYRPAQPVKVYKPN